MYSSLNIPSPLRSCGLSPEMTHPELLYKDMILRTRLVYESKDFAQKIFLLAHGRLTHGLLQLEHDLKSQ